MAHLHCQADWRCGGNQAGRVDRLSRAADRWRLAPAGVRAIIPLHERTTNARRAFVSWSQLGRGALIALLACFAGCSPGDAKVVQVSGTVTRAGAPVPNLFLTFLPAQGRPSWGITDEQGHYTLHYDRVQTGAVAGMHTVFVAVKPRTAREEQAMHSGRMKLPSDLHAILTKYGRRETSPLKVEISAEGQVVDIHLD